METEAGTEHQTMTPIEIIPGDVGGGPQQIDTDVGGDHQQTDNEQVLKALDLSASLDSLEEGGSLTDSPTNKNKKNKKNKKKDPSQWNDDKLIKQLKKFATVKKFRGNITDIHVEEKNILNDSQKILCESLRRFTSLHHFAIINSLIDDDFFNTMLTYLVNLPELTTFSMNMNMLTGISIHRFIETYTEQKLAKQKWEAEMAEMEKMESSSIGSSVASTLKSVGISRTSLMSGKSEKVTGGSQLGSFLGSIRGSMRGSMRGSIRGSIGGGSVAGGSIKGGSFHGSVHGGSVFGNVDVMPRVNEDDRPVSELGIEDDLPDIGQTDGNNNAIKSLPPETKPTGEGDGDAVPATLVGDAEAKAEIDAMAGDEELKQDDDEHQRDPDLDLDPDLDPLHASDMENEQEEKGRLHNRFGLQNLQIIDFRNNNLNLDDGWYLLNAFDGPDIMELNGIRLSDIRTDTEISLIDLQDHSIRAAEIMILVLLLRDINVTTHHIREINLSHNAIDAQTCEFLIESLVDLTHITSVDLSYNPITNEEKTFVSIQKISQLLRQTNHLKQVILLLLSQPLSHL